MTSEGSKSRIKWEGGSNEEIRRWPKDVRKNIGADLQRLDDREEPLDSRPMGKSLPGVSELRDEDKDSWYRLLYWPQTSKADMDLARERMKRVRLRNDAPAGKEDESA